MGRVLLAVVVVIVALLVLVPLVKWLIGLAWGLLMLALVLAALIFVAGLIIRLVNASNLRS